MIPIRKGDGTGLSVPGYSELRKGDGTVVWSAGGDTPDSVVSRPTDDNSISQDLFKGAVVETSQTWPEIGAVISSNASGYETAYIYNDAFDTVIDQTDISSLSAGDSFYFDDANLQANTTYRFVMYASGGMTHGYYGSPSFPYVSSDGNLSITAGANEDKDSGANVWNYLKVGNV